MSEARSSAPRVQRRRDKLRAAGLRPVQFWAPDTRAESFSLACARQVAAINMAETAETCRLDRLWQDAADVTGWTS